MPCRSKRTLKLISSASDRSLAFRHESTCAKWIGSTPWQDFNSTTRRSATRKSSHATPSATFLYVTATGTCRNSRYIPRAVVREVYARDQGQCSFVGSNGKRCSERG